MERNSENERIDEHSYISDNDQGLIANLYIQWFKFKKNVEYVL